MYLSLSRLKMMSLPGLYRWRMISAHCFPNEPVPPVMRIDLPSSIFAQPSGRVLILLPGTGEFASVFGAFPVIGVFLPSERNDQDARGDGDLVEDLGDVLHVLHQAGLDQFLRDDDRVARLHPGRHEPAGGEAPFRLLAPDHRAARR